MPPARLPRRSFLTGAAQGVASLAALGFWGTRLGAGTMQEPGGDDFRGSLPRPHVPPRARRVVFLYMAGGPSQLESFDPKPRLAEMDGKLMPESLTRGQQLAQLQGQALRCMGPQFPFARHGESGLEICTLFPHLGELADRLCVVRSMQTPQINHDPAHTFMNTGHAIAGRPSMGSWLSYGLGSVCEDLPGFIVLNSTGSGSPPQPIAARQWSAGFLPSRHQGVPFRSGGTPVHYVENPPGVDRDRQGEIVDVVRAMNELHHGRTGDPEAETRRRQYEMAFRMQASVPGLMDLSGESPATLERYGTDGRSNTFSTNCLLARRLLERGVRFVQLYHRGWDHHGHLRRDFPGMAAEADRASAALIRDLAERGMLDDTLVVWGGEFGRTPMGQYRGRDHHILGFSMVLAGGGVRGGICHGETDELGYQVVRDPVHVHDLHATMLHLLGVDHERLRYRHQGRDFRLTDVAGRVVHEILA